MALGTALTIASIAATATGSVMSFKQAAEERRRGLNAEAAADKAIESAMDSAEKNFYDKLSIKKTPYQMEKEAALAVSANAMEAARESERGASAAAGRLAMVSNNQVLDSTSRMTGQLQRLQELQAGEDARLEAEKRKIMIAEAEGAGIAANEANNNYISSMTSGFNSGINAINSGVEAVPLFTKSRKARESANVDPNAPVLPYGAELLAGGVKPPADPEPLPYGPPNPSVDPNAPVSPYGADLLSKGVQPQTAAGPSLPYGADLLALGVQPSDNSASRARISNRLLLMEQLLATGVYTPESLSGKSDEELKALLGLL